MSEKLYLNHTEINFLFLKFCCTKSGVQDPKSLISLEYIMTDMV